MAVSRQIRLIINSTASSASAVINPDLLREERDTELHYRDGRVSRQSEAASRTTTATSTTHQAFTWWRASTADTASARTTPAAIIQSSPTMKSYQKRRKCLR